MTQRVVRHDQTGHVVRAEVDDDPVAHTEEAAIGVRGELDAMDLLTGVRGGGEVLAPVLAPQHGTPEHPRRVRDQQLLDVQDALLAEAAAHIGGDDAHRPGVQAERVGDRLAQPVRGLRTGPDGQPAAVRVDLGRDRAGLDRRRDIAVCLELLAHHGMRGGERLVRIADPGGHRDRDVVTELLVDQGRFGGKGLFRVHGDGQRGVADVDEFEGVLGEVAVLGEHDGDGLADVSDLVGGEQGHGRHPDQRVQKRGETGRGAQLLLVEHGCQPCHIGACPDGDHAGGVEGGTDVHRLDARVGLRAAQERGLDAAGKGYVVHVTAVAAQQPLVLDARDGPADIAGGLVVGHVAHAPKRSSSAWHTARRMLR